MIRMINSYSSSELRVNSSRLSWISALGASVTLALAIVAQPTLARTPDTFADVVEDVMPAVVNISTVQLVEGRKRGQRSMPQLPRGGPWEDMFKDFLEQFGDQLPQGEDDGGDRPLRRARSLGSGFIIEPDGLIVTNNHVIEDADEIRVLLADDTILEAQVIGRDPQGDLALIKVESEKPLPTLKWGDSDKMRVGDWSIAI